MKPVKAISRALIIFLMINVILVGPIGGIPENGNSYERGIFLKDHQTLLIENRVIHLDGDIIIKGNAKLVIRNSTIIWKLTHFVSHVARVFDNGELIVENSILDRSININANLWIEGDSSSVTITNSKCTWDIIAVNGKLEVISSSIVGANGIFFFGRSKPKVTIQDSHIRTIPIKISGEKEIVRIKNMKPGFIPNLIIRTSEGAKLEITASNIDGWVIDIDLYNEPIKYNQKHLIIEDSELSSLWIWFPYDSFVKMKNWGPGYYQYWNLRDNAILENIQYDLTLVNTSIMKSIKLQALGKCEFDNMRNIQIASWGNADIFVNNSIITAGLLMRGRNDSVKLYNSIVKNGDLILMNASHLAGFGGDFHTLELKNTRIEQLNVIEIATSYSVIRGEVFLSPQLEKVLRWSYGKVVREVTIIVMDENGNPISDAIVNVLDHKGELVAGKLTDAHGQVTINITFDSGSYDKEYVIEAFKAPLIAIEKIKFLSSSPLKLILKEVKTTATKTLTMMKKERETLTVTKTEVQPLTTTEVFLKEITTTIQTTAPVTVTVTAQNEIAQVIPLTIGIIVVVAIIVFITTLLAMRRE